MKDHGKYQFYTLLVEIHAFPVCSSKEAPIDTAQLLADHNWLNKVQQRETVLKLACGSVGGYVKTNYFLSF